MERTSCCIIGGGPAGLVLGLLLARCGVAVTIVEKHGDFLRDFRGDTVHPATLSLLDDLGLGEKFARLPQRRVDRIQIPLGVEGNFFTLGDFSQLRTRYNYIAMVPQWHLLDLLADAGRQESSFRLWMNTEATDLIREAGRVNGLRYRANDGTVGEIRATITVACDGRDSLSREMPELGLREFPTPMDVWWFRLPRRPQDPAGAVATMSDQMMAFLIDRGDYFQTASLIAKGTDAAHRRRPIEEFHRSLIHLLPWLAGRELVCGWDEIKLLDVKLDRLRKWHVPGLLCIGDAAHAMSPVGGVGINLAVQDAVAAARHLAQPLRRGQLSRDDVAAVQRRRWPTTALIQGFQRVAHRKIVEPALAGSIDVNDPVRLPMPLIIVNRVPPMRRIPAYLLSYGALREQPPAAALR